MLDTFHVPLVYENNDAFTFRLVNFLEQFSVKFVNEDFLELGEVDIGCLDEPIKGLGIKALLCKGLVANMSQHSTVSTSLQRVLSIKILVTLYDVLKNVSQACLMLNSCPSLLIKFWS